MASDGCCRACCCCVMCCVCMLLAIGIIALLSSSTEKTTMAESAGEQSTGEPFRIISQRWSALSHFTTASVLFTQRINTSQSPCNSFFEFTCTAQSGEDANDKYSTIGSNMMQLAEELLSTPPKDEIEPLAKARAFFHKCVSFASGKDDGGKEGVLEQKFREFLSITGLKPTMFDQSGVEEQGWPSPTSVGRAIAMLAVDGAGSLLSPQVVVDVEGSGMNNYRAVYRLHLGAMQLSFPTSHYSKPKFLGSHFPELVEIVLNLFSHEVGIKASAQTITQARERIVHFEKTMMHHISATLVRDFDELNSISAAAAQQQYSDVVDIEALMDTWQTKGGISKASQQSSRVPMVDGSQLGRLWLLLRDQNEHGLSPAHLIDWLLWRHMWANADYLQLEKTPGYFLRIKGENKHPSSSFTKSDPVGVEGKWLMERSVHTCIHDLMTQALPLAERLLIERIHPSAVGFRNRLYDGVKRMFRLQLGKYRVALRRTQWLGVELKRFALDHTRRLKLLLSAPTRVLNDSLLIDHYAGWTSDSASNESFAFMREKLRRHKHSLEVKKLLYSEADSSEDAVLWDFDEESILLNPSASYTAGLNALYLPANYIQPPLYHPDWPSALNYGGLGYVIGHEISHQLTALLRISTLNAYLLDREHWSNVEKLKKCLIDEYNAFCPFKDACVNGQQTMDENLADIAGLQLAFASYRRETLDRNDWATFNVSSVMPSSTSDNQMMFDRLFFTAFGHYACVATKYEWDTRSQLANDPHSPYRYRLLGSLRNFAYFSRAFKCNYSMTDDYNSGQESYQRVDDDRCKLWNIF